MYSSLLTAAPGQPREDKASVGCYGLGYEPVHTLFYTTDFILDVSCYALLCSTLVQVIVRSVGVDFDLVSLTIVPPVIPAHLLIPEHFVNECNV